MKKSTSTNTNDLNAWLYANELSQIMDVLEENEEEIEEFAEELGLSNKLKKKFVQNVMKLNGIQQPNGHSDDQTQRAQPTKANDLKAWLSANGFAKMLNKLQEKDVSSLEDLQMFDTEDEILEFAQ